MKKYFLLATLIGSCICVHGQEKISNANNDKVAYEKIKVEERAAKLVEGISSKVSIDADQKNRIYELALNQVKSEKEIKARYRTQKDKSGLSTELDSNLQNYSEGIKRILTPDQLKTLHEKVKN
ncbi:MAG: hypothetical protein K0R26_1207 [Bacteroidota bacterium]|jgi:hypothetical protein|nr:hypothetical protein [Bacteroidota bacterium]